MTAFLALENVPIEKDKKEIGRWLSLHHCEPMSYPTSEGVVLAAKIPLVCKWLEYDKEKNCFKCKDYEHRPVVCRDYFCPKTKESTIAELVKEHGICT